MFDLQVIGQKRTIFNGTAKSVWVDGVESEFEFLSFHAEAVGILRKGEIVIDNRRMIPIQSGVVNFANNKCLILVEEK